MASAAFTPLPMDIQDFQAGSWKDLEPWFVELMAADLTAESLADFLRQVSDLDECTQENANRLHVAAQCDSADPAKERAWLDYQRELGPRVDQAYDALNRKLLASGLSAPGMERPLMRLRAWTGIFREENLPLGVELGALEHRFNRWSSAWRADFEGGPRTSSEMARHLEDPDRARREAAWRASMGAYGRDRGLLDGLYDEMLALRQRQALNAGFSRYTELRFQDFGRFDYTPQDCLALHEAVAATAVPLARRVSALRERGLGLEPGGLRPWDLELDGLAAGAPRQREGAPGLEEGMGLLLQRCCPDTAGHYRRLRDLGHLDLLDRPGKRLAGFCSPLERSRSCFIYMTANGSPTDVLTLAHEAGHAMHSMEAQRRLDYSIQRAAPIECCEGVAMAVELLSLRHLEVFYTPREAALVGLRELMKIPAFLGYACAIDAFQHWAYGHPTAGHAQRDAWAAQLAARFMPGQGWEAFPDEQATFWQRKQHVFNSALYYVEYAYAQLFALQVWRRGRSEPDAARAGLVAAMALGGTVGLPGFHRAAGAEFRQDAAFLAGLMADLERGINEGLAALGWGPL